MENLGKYFLELRIKRDLSYKRIWEDIRIREEQVKSLEENRIFELGPYGVAKALVFNYARYLEADIDAVMHEFKVMMPDTTRSKFTPSKAVKEKKIMLSTNFLWMVGIILIVVILGSILVHAYRQGWLAKPMFSSAPAADSTRLSQDGNSEPAKENKPDTLRTRMRILSENIQKNGTPNPTPQAATTALSDTTDYLGNILEDSPVNVPVH